MGKRELLLILAFLAAGVVVYRVTAPPAEPGQPGFSLSGLVAHIESALKGERVEAAVIRRARVDAPAEPVPLSLKDFRGTLTIIAESREDIDAELHAVAFGVDEEAAKHWADQIVLKLDEGHGQIDVLVQQADRSGPNRRPNFELTLRVPEEQRVALGMRSGEAEVRGVSVLDLQDGRGKVTILDTDRVEGSFQGDINGQRIDIVNIKVRRGEVRFDEVHSLLEIDAEHSDLTLRKIDGPVKLTLESLDCNLEDVDGPATIEGHHTKVDVRNPRAPLTVNTKNSTVTVVLADAVATTITNDDGTIDVRLPKEGMQIDAATTDGDIRPADRAMHVEVKESTKTLIASVDGGGPLLKLRNKNGHIFLR
jgi:hypothetical protein